MRNEYAPEAAGLDWVADAACAGMDPDDFFVEAGRIIDDHVLTVCRNCPVRVECLTYAYERNFTSGYFGGFSPGQRRNMTLAQAVEAMALEDADIEETDPEDAGIADAAVGDADPGTGTADADVQE